jgi:hypothetical protein
MTSTIHEHQKNNLKIVSKPQKILAIAFIVLASVTGQVVAQKATETQKNVNETTANSDVRTAVVRIVATSTGCDVVLGATIKSPRDPSSGVATGKRQHGPISVLYETTQNDGIVNGNHIKEAKISSSNAKVSMQDFHFTMKSRGKSIAVTSEDGVCKLPVDLPDGDYILSCDWSWGAHNSGSSFQKVIDCNLKLEGGVCVGMVINDKGHIIRN